MNAERLVRDATARWRRCVNGVLVMAADATEPFFLAAPGDAIWHLLATPRTIEELVIEMTSRFEGDRGAIAADVDSFLAELERLTLVRR